MALGFWRGFQMDGSWWGRERGCFAKRDDRFTINRLQIPGAIERGEE